MDEQEWTDRMRTISLSRDEIAGAKRAIRAVGQQGYAEMMQILNHRMGVARTLMYPQTRRLAAVRAYLAYFSLAFLLFVPLLSLFTTGWCWSLVAIAFYYFVLNRWLQTYVNLELGARLMLLDEQLLPDDADEVRVGGGEGDESVR